ncbi:MAG: hypothetical protein IKO28_03185 [Prevotella sp.]|nr:hypothetical protein [Prevotella sp.]
MAVKKQENPNPNWSHKHDYPIEEMWNTENTLAQLIVPRLQAFKALDKHGCPNGFEDMCEWNKTIQKMIDAFELMKYAAPTNKDEERRIEQGLDLFRKYFRHLWD